VLKKEILVIVLVKVAKKKKPNRKEHDFHFFFNKTDLKTKLTFNSLIKKN